MGTNKRKNSKKPPRRKVPRVPGSKGKPKNPKKEACTGKVSFLGPSDP
jgi:hypothetical protein